MNDKRKYAFECARKARLAMKGYNRRLALAWVSRGSLVGRKISEGK